MHRMTTSGNMSVKSCVFIRGIMHFKNCTIGLNNRIFTLYNVTIPMFTLRFVIFSMVIIYSIFKLVLSWSLRKKYLTPPVLACLFRYLQNSPREILVHSVDILHRDDKVHEYDDVMELPGHE